MTTLNDKTGLSPSGFAELIGLEYAISTSDMHKKSCGQFFTPKMISDFMGDLAAPNFDKISILDPGCGTAILSCSLIEKIVSKTAIKEISLTLYETDLNVVKETRKVVAFLTEWLKEMGISLHAVIHQTDFIIANSAVFASNSLFETGETEKFDYIISNPPYFKISKADRRARIAKELVYGQPNIYSIFMGLAAKLLKPEGELIFITPRSFAAGNYFSAFRQSFFKLISISDIHIFESRNKMFKSDNVLQENIILRATKQYNPKIKVTTSECEKGLNKPKTTIYDTEDLIDLKSKDKILFIPSNLNEAEAIEVFRNWSKSLNDYNIQISTGPVVAFRCKDLLRKENLVDEQHAPLIWLHNIKEMEFVFPLKKGDKASFIVHSDTSRKVLLPNKNYILIRRFSSKEDKSRLVCCPYFSSNIKSERIGIENHVNYIYRPNGELSDEEIWGISALFNSSLFDAYFRTFNGNTQVGATELKQIRMPSLEAIIIIGNRIKAIENPQKQEIDKIINEVLLEKSYVKSSRSSSNFERAGVA